MKPRFTGSIKAVGLMSGTSLDGLDLVAVVFFKTCKKWDFIICATETVEYSAQWKNRLKDAPNLSGMELISLHTEYGRYLGNETKRFTDTYHFHPDIIASHGHTVFHQPFNGFTFQAGSGFEIAAVTGITTIADFRQGDVSLGGQGAPLVPVGDRYLFQDYDYCLNLGGFANISFAKNDEYVAFDICPVNIILNHFAEKQGLSFDKNGELGRKGVIDHKLLNKLNQIGYYNLTPPKSLGREWVEQQFMTVLHDAEISDSNKLRTVYEHIALQVANTVAAEKKEKSKMLVTGGGAFNTLLLELIRAQTNIELVIPDKIIVNFKEALIFAFLGVLKYLGEINCFASVTGAKSNSSSGLIFRF